MNFVVYDNNSGEVLRTGSCSVEDLLHQAMPSESLLEGEADLSSHYVANNVLTAYTAEQSSLKRARPVYPSTWSNTTMSWADTRSLEEVKAAKRAEINAARDTAEFSTFTWDGSVFDCDSVSTGRIMGAFSLALAASVTGQPFSEDWTLANNEVRTLSAQDMLAVGAALGKQVGELHERASQLKAQIKAAQTADEVATVIWAV